MAEIIPNFDSECKILFNNLKSIKSGEQDVKYHKDSEKDSLIVFKVQKGKKYTIE